MAMAAWQLYPVVFGNAWLGMKLNAFNAQINTKAIPLQRSRGVGRLCVSASDVASKKSAQVKTLYQEGCAKIRLPKTYGSTGEAIMINSSGGMTGGDFLDWEFEAKDNSNLTITSQACERVYKSYSGAAHMNVSLKAGEGACLNWLPQETILFDQGALNRKLDVELAKDAKALILESIVFGRKAMGESVKSGALHDRWRVRVDGDLVHAEDFKVSGDVETQLHDVALTGGNIAVATLLHISPKTEFLLEEARKIIGNNGGASFWQVGAKENVTGKMLARIIAKDSYELRKILVPLIGLLSDEETLPKVWSL